MGKLNVKYLGGRAFEASSRSHKFIIDQPLGLNGKDAGPTPTELFVTSLASCVGIELAFYCEKFKWDPTGLEVEANYANLPDRIGKISLEVSLPSAKSEEERKETLGWAEKCFIHNTILHGPEIKITFNK